MIIIIIVTIIIIVIINTSVGRAPPRAQLGGKPDSLIYMNGTVQLTIIIAKAFPPYSSASGGARWLSSHYYLKPLGSQAALSPAQHGHKPLTRLEQPLARGWDAEQPEPRDVGRTWCA